MRPLRLALEWFQNPDHVPFFLAQREGWLKDAGLELELIEPREHFDAARALASGEVDVAITEPIHLVQDRLQDIPIVGFTRFLHTNGGVMTLDGLGVERPRDMAGKRVQYPGAPGPGGLAIVRTMIEAMAATQGHTGQRAAHPGEPQLLPHRRLGHGHRRRGHLGVLQL